MMLQLLDLYYTLRIIWKWGHDTVWFGWGCVSEYGFQSVEQCYIVVGSIMLLSSATVMYIDMATGSCILSVCVFYHSIDYDA